MVLNPLEKILNKTIMNKLFLIFLPAVFLFSFLSSCGSRNMYHLEVENTGEKEINEVTVMFDNFNFTFGVLIPGAFNNYAFVGRKHPLPEKMVITWVTMDGKKHKQSVNIKKSVPASFDEIRINLIIDDNNNVTVKWVEDPTYK